MAFSYSGDPGTSARDEVRFLTSDIDENCALNSDAEIDYIIDKWMPLYGSTLFCAAVAARQISRKFARVVDVADGGSSVRTGDLQVRYATMADQLMADYQREGDVGGLINLDNILIGTEFDPSIDPLAFAMSLDDNDRAGSQNWGGMTHQQPERDWIGEVGAL
jgi:hypothetical protein